MSLRKILLGACVSGALFATGATTALAADSSHVGKAGNFDPVAWQKQMCTDRYARDVGRVAYIEAKLSLTDAQRPLFDTWKQTVLGSAKARQGDCLSHQADIGAPHEHNILERQAHMEKMLQHRLADLTAEQPSLKALYDSLSPDQKQVFDREGPMGMRGGPRGMQDHGDWEHHGPMGPDQQAD